MSEKSFLDESVDADLWDVLTMFGLGAGIGVVIGVISTLAGIGLWRSLFR